MRSLMCFLVLALCSVCLVGQEKKPEVKPQVKAEEEVEEVEEGVPAELLGLWKSPPEGEHWARAFAQKDRLTLLYRLNENGPVREIDLPVTKIDDGRIWTPGMGPRVLLHEDDDGEEILSIEVRAEDEEGEPLRYWTEVAMKRWPKPVEER